MGFESTLGWKLLYREELREEPVIDAHRYTAVVAIHVHIIVTHHGQSFKAPRKLRFHADSDDVVPKSAWGKCTAAGCHSHADFLETRFWIDSGWPTNRGVAGQYDGSYC